jgi:hypothetical protein
LRALAVLAGCGVLGSARAAEPLPPAAPLDTVVAARLPSPHPDVVLSRTVLTALDAEPDLRGVNLLVSVVDRVAVISGAVGNARQSLRAEQIVRGVPGITDVRNTCFVSVGPDPLLKAVADRVGSNLPPRPVMPQLPGVLTNTPQPVSPFPGPSPGGELVPALAPGEVVVARRPPATGEGFLGAPVAGASGRGNVATESPPTPPKPAVHLTGARAAELLAAVREVKASEARFAHLMVEQRDGVLLIGGRAPLAADAWDLAQKLRSLPGANRVVVGVVVGK